ncbi:ricin-type beta-trefoil lectin domain protein [Nonomuraea sp. 3N208]|uniref:ricin-type beta-trefoil lectin domain protein n=1 Tax=Nonomuraea sp. 3N208 TaxID=3457421 RepID=UPI003FCF0889
MDSACRPTGLGNHRCVGWNGTEHLPVVTQGGAGRKTCLSPEPATARTTRKSRLNTDGTITAVGPNKCLDVSGTANGTKARIWTCTGGTNQRWHLRGPPSFVQSIHQRGRACRVQVLRPALQRPQPRTTDSVEVKEQPP